VFSTHYLVVLWRNDLKKKYYKIRNSNKEEIGLKLKETNNYTRINGTGHYKK